MSDKNTFRGNININREPISRRSVKRSRIPDIKAAILVFSVAAAIIAPLAGTVFFFWRYHAVENLSYNNGVLASECKVLENKIAALKEENARLSDHNRIAESAGQLGMYECPESDRDYVYMPEEKSDSENADKDAAASR